MKVRVPCLQQNDTAMISPPTGPTKHNDAEQGPILEESQETGSVPSEVDADEAESLTTVRARPLSTKPGLIVIFIFVLGTGAAAAILGLNIPAAKMEQENRFSRLAEDVVQKFDVAFERYMVAGMWLHQACRGRDMTHESFRVVYEYLNSTGLEFQAVSFAMKITNDTHRVVLENQTSAYVKKKYPNVGYRGFVGYELDDETGELAPGPRSFNQSFYFPVHFVEPMEDKKNQVALDFDIYTSPKRRLGIDKALTTGKPVMTEPLKLIKESQEGTESYAYSVIVFHPGTEVNESSEKGSSDLGVLAIRMPELLMRSYGNNSIEDAASVYIFDSTDSRNYPLFLGGANLLPCQYRGSTLTFSEETQFQDLREMKVNHRLETDINVASRRLTFVVVADENSFKPELHFIILAAVMIFLACTCLALWIWTNSRRVAKMNEIQSLAEAEKAEMVVQSARKAAKQERELNDFIAHEVRNPLAAAISACSFVSASVSEAKPLLDVESRKSVREDVTIIDNSLQFINDLLRNMLDMHRASSKQLKIERNHVDLLEDVLQPVASMIYKREDNFDLLVECPKHVIVMSDGLRLKQIMLNLGRNAAKFVTKGFVRLRVEKSDDNVFLFVEDSGPGVPLDKRNQLFAKFQESLDSLNQGTGIGLCLCKNLMDLMGGDIRLDESYDSGVEGLPGARFIITLNSPPVHWEPTIQPQTQHGDDSKTHSNIALTNNACSLPSQMSVLFVDDSFVLRKLFSRALKKIVPEWQVEEAASGETALMLAEKHDYDLIFMDQYMASTDKQLLGTETVRALRAAGVKSIICGLSANDLGKAFENAGANAFMIKPFPCERNEMISEILRVLRAGGVEVPSSS